MARRRSTEAASPGSYDSLIDAERDVLIQAGRTPNRAALVRALRSAAPDLAPRAASRAVDLFIRRRGGSIPLSSASDDARTGWIDDLLDAERGRAARDDRPVTIRALRRAVRQATPHLTPRARRDALDDYLHRRAGRTPPRRRRLGLALIAAAGLLLIAWLFLRPR